MVDINGSVGAFTGESCIESAGHYIGENFSEIGRASCRERV